LVGYVRVSVEEESLENREFVIARWVASRGYRLVNECRDAGVSDRNLPAQRARFKRCLQLMDEGRADSLVGIRYSTAKQYLSRDPEYLQAKKWRPNLEDYADASTPLPLHFYKAALRDPVTHPLFTA